MKNAEYLLSDTCYASLRSLAKQFRDNDVAIVHIDFLYGRAVGSSVCRFENQALDTQFTGLLDRLSRLLTHSESPWLLRSGRSLVCFDTALCALSLMVTSFEGQAAPLEFSSDCVSVRMYDEANGAKHDVVLVSNGINVAIEVGGLSNRSDGCERLLGSLSIANSELDLCLYADSEHLQSGNKSKLIRIEHALNSSVSTVDP